MNKLRWFYEQSKAWMSYNKLDAAGRRAFWRQYPGAWFRFFVWLPLRDRLRAVR